MPDTNQPAKEAMTKQAELREQIGDVLDEYRQAITTAYEGKSAGVDTDRVINLLAMIFESKQLPVFTPFLGWHKAYKNGTYPEFNDLSPSQMLDKLERNYPEAYKKFMEMSL